MSFGKTAHNTKKKKLESIQLEAARNVTGADKASVCRQPLY